MTEYSSIRTSSWDVDAMVTKLNDAAHSGWALVTVVNTGSDLAAILQRTTGDTGSTYSTAEPEVVEPVVEPALVVADAVDAPTPVEEPAGWAAQPQPTSEPYSPLTPAVEPSATVEPVAVVVAEAVVTEPVVPQPTVSEPVVDSAPTANETHAGAPVEPEPVVQQATAQAVPVTPAGWYPDPSGRYEMRYWDGLAWTEHVARGGQQYTDPPVA